MTAPVPAAETLLALPAGHRLGEFTVGPISRQQIAIYAGASGDYNGIHVDTDAARAAGLPDVIVHGMYTMGQLSRLLTPFTPRAQIVDLSTRFQAMVEVHATLTCTALLTGARREPDGIRVDIALSARKADGTEVASGAATLLFT
jgi:acyl dehydratase